MAEYKHVASVISRELTYQADQHGLRILDHQGGEKRRFSWDDLKRINLLRMSLEDSQHPNFITTLTFGRQKIRFSSMSTKGVGDFENRAEEYKVFVQAIHSYVKDHRRIQFTQGGTKALLYFIVAFMVFGIICFPVLLYVSLIKGKYDVSIGMALGAFITIYFGTSFYRTFRPLSYDPNHISSDLLPD